MERGRVIECKIYNERLGPGIYAKFQLNSWWEVRTRLELLQRSGNFNVTGFQTVQISQLGGSEPRTDGIVPFYLGKVQDTGSVFMLETSFRYCRFNLDLGFIQRSFTRKYSSYYEETLGNINRYDYSTRTSIYGLGEVQGKSHLQRILYHTKCFFSF